ncbi:uncharacterized protein CMC5_018100 [Chondromyces crocatus]|uniref:Uncharacterized protein n=1 Tax=Chondromyces crocatus TaxID=52 RepID=A0A0K1EAS8_CHOCO|nr:uncharacterized protein CMC5_018100 [Chondromyces crocatus]
MSRFMRRARARARRSIVRRLLDVLRSLLRAFVWGSAALGPVAAPPPPPPPPPIESREDQSASRDQQ